MHLWLWHDSRDAGVVAHLEDCTALFRAAIYLTVKPARACISAVPAHVSTQLILFTPSVLTKHCWKLLQVCWYKQYHFSLMPGSTKLGSSKRERQIASNCSTAASKSLCTYALIFMLLAATIITRRDVQKVGSILAEYTNSGGTGSALVVATCDMELKFELQWWTCIRAWHHGLM